MDARRKEKKKKASKNKKNKNIIQHKERNEKYIFLKFKKSSTLKKNVHPEKKKRKQAKENKEISKRMKTSLSALNFGSFRKKMFWQISLGDFIIMIFPHYDKVNKL